MQEAYAIGKELTPKRESIQLWLYLGNIMEVIYDMTLKEGNWDVKRGLGEEVVPG